MDQQYLYVLLAKYSQGTCTAEELAMLETWYTGLGQHLPDQVIDPENEMARQLTQAKLKELRAQVNKDKEPPVLYIPLWKKAARMAAIWGGLLLLAGAGYYLIKQDQSKQVKYSGFNTGEKQNYSRYITLPDGSTVILHAGSKLDFPVAFTGKTREVELSGEAYFDIRRDSARPFIINTGRLKTTVLGTAFNIRAYPDLPDITVSVTRGKVKVEDDKKVLAVLTPDQQIVYNIQKATAAQQKVNAIAKISWTTEDMVFENTTFESIVATLNKRYQVNIQFSNEALKSCQIRASFSGTESLEQVLDVLCGVRNATYTIENGRNILINGKGCGL